MNKLELLVVEDNPKHLDDAKKLYEKNGKLNVSYAKNKEEAINYLSSESYDMVISDVFMPSNERGVEKQDIDDCWSLLKMDDFLDFHGRNVPLEYQKGYMSAAFNWKEGKTLPPLGVLIAEKLKDSAIVFCSDSYHHGKASEPISQYARGEFFENSIPYIDDGATENGAASKKNWESALENCLHMYEVYKLPKEELLFMSKEDVKKIGKNDMVTADLLKRRMSLLDDE